MLFQLTDVEFDFDDGEEISGELPYDEQVAVAQSVIGEVFDVESEDDLADAVSDYTGWCVKSVNYVAISESH